MDFKGMGRYLQKERKARKISLKEIAGETRINIGYLRAIEEGRSEEVPQEPYLTAFLKAFCQQIGLDFHEVKGMFSTEATPPTESQPPPPPKRWWIGILFLPILILILVILYPRNAKREVVSPPSLQRRHDTASVAVFTTPGTLTTTILDTLPQVSPLRPDSLKLEMVGLESTWVYLEEDSELVWEGILTAGQRKVWFSSVGFQATVGNASGVEIFLNGKRLPRLGPRGKVLHNLKLDRQTGEGLLQQ